MVCRVTCRSNSYKPDFKGRHGVGRATNVVYKNDNIERRRVRFEGNSRGSAMTFQAMNAPEGIRYVIGAHSGNILFILSPSGATQTHQALL